MSVLLDLFVGSPRNKFKKYMKNSGYKLDEIIEDGKIHYFQAEKLPTLSCFYALLKDESGHYCGVFGNWEKKIFKIWDGGKRSQNDDREHEMQSLIDKVKHAIKLKYRQWKPLDIWRNAKLLGTDKAHPFLLSKKLSGTLGNVRIWKGKLVIPIKDIHQKLVSVQTIDEKGVKKFSNKKGLLHNYFYIKGKSNFLYVCLSYETAATIKMARKGSVVCVFEAENLQPVVLKFRENHPELKIILIADNDCTPAGRECLKTFIAIENQVSAKIISPSFPVQGKGQKTFNDLLIQGGIQAVKNQFHQHKQEFVGGGEKKVLEGGDVSFGKIQMGIVGNEKTMEAQPKTEAGSTLNQESARIYDLQDPNPNPYDVGYSSINHPESADQEKKPAVQMAVDDSLVAVVSADSTVLDLTASEPIPHEAQHAQVAQDNVSESHEEETKQRVPFKGMRIVNPLPIKDILLAPPEQQARIVEIGEPSPTDLGDNGQDIYAIKIIGALLKAPSGLTGKELYAVFSNHLPKRKMEKTLNRLIAHNKIVFQKKKTKGRPKKIFFLRKDARLLL